MELSTSSSLDAQADVFFEEQDLQFQICSPVISFTLQMVAFARGAMGRRIDPSWGGPIELFLVPASAPRLV